MPVPTGMEISAKINFEASIDLAINNIGNNLKSASAYLLLNGKKQASIVADTLVLN